MNWEELKVYRKLPKEQLSKAKKDVTKIISDNLAPYGFKLYGRKLIRLSEDLFHVIHLDTRGSWMGASESLKTEIAVVSIYDADVFIKNYELSFRKNIEELIPGLKNYYQITQEYELFSEYMSKKLIEHIIPYFKNFRSCKDILKNKGFDTVEENWHNPSNPNSLIFYAELGNHLNKNLSSILNYKIDFYKSLSQDDSLKELIMLKQNVDNSDWDRVSAFLEMKKSEVLKKLTIK